MEVKVIPEKIIDYLDEFLQDSKSIGIVLIICTVLSLVIANLPYGVAYSRFFRYENLVLQGLHLPHNLLHWINDGFMAVFFFLAGLEIKRELISGELASFDKAILPVGAAVGGMVIPAFIYIIFNKATVYQAGWGIPMATDIAFSLGIAAMLGKSFPSALKVFLVALAIIDDLGAILVIAFFYGGNIGGWWLLAGGCCLGILGFFNYKKYRFTWLNVVLGVLLWYFVYNSGIHATLAGVLFAFVAPREQIRSLEHAFHKTVNFVILPVFALANTSIVINPELIDDAMGTLGLGLFLGLFVGKPVGVLLFSWLLVNNKVAKLPEGVNWAQLTGSGILAGIGFTMSIFIASLAFDDPKMQNVSKLVVLISAVLSIATVIIWMKLANGKKQEAEGA